MIKVALNTEPLQTGHQTRGIGFYTKNLLINLKEVESIQLSEFTNISDVKDVDVVHYPFFDLFFRSLPLQRQAPTVVTIHDVTPLVFSQHYPPGIKGTINNFWQKISLQSVQAIITDSLASKKDIQRYLGVNPSKIYPIYLAPGDHFKQIVDQTLLNKISRQYKLPTQFALFLGSVNWNKNLLNMARACLKANISLVLVGKDFESTNNLDHPERRGYGEFLREFISNPLIIKLGFVPNEHLAAIMNLAEVLLLPSFYEGFGLPILEAQVCGTPVVTSNLSSMPEIAGKGAILIDPNNVDDICKAIKVVINNKNIQEKLVKYGFENVKRFSWEKTTQQTVEVYEKVIKR